jgi:cytochrome c oxidase subunit II
MRREAVVAILLAFVFPALNLAHAKPHEPTITIHAKRFEFDPPEITLKQGQPVKLVFISNDVPHGIAVDGLGIHMDFRKNHPAHAVVTPLTTGDFVGRCSVYCGTGHDMMKLVIHVVP